MNKFYHVNNKGRNAKSHWLIAKDKEDAMRIASTEKGTPQDLEELEPTANIPKLLKSGKTGLLCCEIQSTSMKDIIARANGEKVEEKKNKEPWSIYKEV